uniref:Uncharacterized protein n=1 Tax=Helianthus annuus TaxID=4232 RepID=A0A251RXF2_HELAN
MNNAVNEQRASELSEIGSKDTEQKYEKSVKKIEQDEEIEETKPDVEIEKMNKMGYYKQSPPMLAP